MEINKKFKLIIYKFLYTFLSLLDLYANIFEKRFIGYCLSCYVISNSYSCYRIKNK